MNTRAAIGCLLLTGLVVSPSSFPTATSRSRASVVKDYGNLPLSFEADEGQVAGSAARFLSRGHGYTLFLNAAEALLSLGTDVIRLKCIGANLSPTIIGLDELPGKSNYFIGDDPAKWRTNVPNYAKVKIENVYPGIDLVYYGNQQRLEYDWVVNPGADPDLIRFAVDGRADLVVDPGGNLLLDEKRGIRLDRPMTYQLRAGTRAEVAATYRVGTHDVGFELGQYDTALPLIIDPILQYSTYLGGSGVEGELLGIDVDSSGCAYIAAATNSADFPRVNPFQSTFRGNTDVFVTKMNSAGTALLYSTYLGGSNTDYAVAMAVDSSGNACVTGWTESPNFPTANPFQPTHRGSSDVFVTKLSATGSALVYSTYLGGSGSDGGWAVAVDSSGNAYVAGQTDSANFPTSNAYQANNRGSSDVFITKLSPSGGALVYSTYLGGSGDDQANGIAVDASGDAFVTGETESTNFPMASPFQASYGGGSTDAFVAKLNPVGTGLIYATYLGGSGNDHGRAITVDASGDPYVTGDTQSTNFPTLNALQASSAGDKDIFVTKLNPGWNALFYSTYLGGSGSDYSYGIAVDDSGNAYVTGYTESTNFPLLNALQATYGGGRFDALITKLNASGRALVYSTYLGGSDVDGAFAITVDSSGNAYVAGLTASTNFPRINAAQSNYGGGGADVFVTKIGEVNLQITIGTNPVGCSFVVDGNTYTSTQVFSWAVGSSHTITAVTPQGSGGTRRVFAGWSDTGAASHVITINNAPGSPSTYTANFTTQYQLTTSSSPVDGGTVNASPSSADDYYASGTQVQLMAMAQFGYLFSGWSGNLLGTTNPQTMPILAPCAVTANFVAMPRMSINAGGAAKYTTPGTNAAVTAGYTIMRLLPGGVTPYGTAVFSYRQNGVTVSEAGVPASPPTTRARIFIDYRMRVHAVPARTEAGLIDINTGIAVVNPGDASADVTYTLRDSAGNTITTGHGTVPAGVHFSCFIDQLRDRAGAPDFNLPPDFPTAIQSGSLEISSTQALSVLGLRGTMNQRGEFLMTTTPVADLRKATTSAPAYFPQFVDGGGYTTSLILLNTSTSEEIGTLQILDDNGAPLSVRQAGGTADSSFRYSIPPAGSFRFQTDGSPAEVKRGWVRLTPAFNQTPVASGVFGYNPGIIMVSESGIPSVVSTTQARIYVDLSRNHNTGLAIANVDSTAASIAIKAFQTDGVTEVGRNQGPLQLPGGGHDAKFADQFISGLPQAFTGVLDISSATPFAALTIRSLWNEREEFLMTTFPVADANVLAPWPYFPQVVDGGGYVTEFILLISPKPGWGAGTVLYFYSENGSTWKIQP